MFDKGAAVEIKLSFKGLEGDLQFISEELAQVPGVERTDFAPAPRPEAGRKGGEAVSALIVRLVPDAIEAVIGMIGKTIKRLTPLPTKVAVTIAGETVSMEFDPRFESSAQVAKATNEIIKHVKAARSKATAR